MRIEAENKRECVHYWIIDGSGWGICKLCHIEAERARERQLSQLKQGDVTPVVENFPQRVGKTRDKVAERARERQATQVLLCSLLLKIHSIYYVLIGMEYIVEMTIVNVAKKGKINQWVFYKNKKLIEYIGNDKKLEEWKRLNPDKWKIKERKPELYVARAEDLYFISDNTIDLIITSPPYNLGQEKWPMGGNGRTARETENNNKYRG